MFDSVQLHLVIAVPGFGI